MPGEEVEVPTGRAVSAPETPSEGRRTKVTGPVPVRLIAPSLTATVLVSDRAPAAYAVIGGDKAQEVKFAWEDGTWTLTWPEDAGHVSSGGTQAGSNNFQFNDFSSRGGFSGSPVDQPAAYLILPSGSSLFADLTAGQVTVHEAPDPRHGLTLLSVKSASADVSAACAVGSAVFSSMSGSLDMRGFTGPVRASTMSGSASLAHAAADVEFSSMSGGLRLHAEGDVGIMANTMSGDVTVSAADGARPRVSASSVSGRVTRP